MAVVDWKNIGVPIILALVAGTVALISALINYIIAALFTPNIEITSELNGGDYRSKIEVSNVGSAPAKDLKLTIEAPPSIEFLEPPFSTERYTYNISTSDSGSGLEIYIPRLVHGSGSMIEIDTDISPTASGNISGDYIVYATHDSGSIGKTLPISDEIPPQLPLNLSENILTFWNQWGSTYTWAGVGVGILTFAIGFLGKRGGKRDDT